MEVGLDPGSDIEWVCHISAILGGCVSQTTDKSVIFSQKEPNLDIPMKQKMLGNHDLVGTDLVNSYP